MIWKDEKMASLNILIGHSRRMKPIKPKIMNKYEHEKVWVDTNANQNNPKSV